MEVNRFFFLFYCWIPSYRCPNLDIIFNLSDVLLGFQITSQIPSRHRTRSTSVNSERYSTSESVDLQSPASPQHLKNLGESLRK